MSGVDRLSENEIEAEETDVEKPAKKVSSDKKKDKSKEDAIFEEKPTVKVGEKDILKRKIKTVFTTSLDEPESQISKEDYQKYNKIMDYLYNYPDIEEEVLFKELESDFNETTEELQQFVHDNMQDAIDYDSGK